MAFKFHLPSIRMVTTSKKSIDKNVINLKHCALLTKQNKAGFMESKQFLKKEAKAKQNKIWKQEYHMIPQFHL